MIKITKCDACDRNMTTVTGETYAGVEININQEGDEGFEEVYPEIKYQKFKICWSCWLKSLGVKL